jgi:radical SAM-linked protein
MLNTNDEPGQMTEDKRPVTNFRQRVRVRFTKQEDLRWISHRDLMRLWERLFRRAGLPLSMTEGFHPKPRIHFPSALAVGIAGSDELLEVDFAEPITAQMLRESIVAQAPPGMTIGEIEVLPAPDRKAQASHVTFEIGVPTESLDTLRERIRWLLDQTTFSISREGRKAELDLRPLIADLQLNNTVLNNAVLQMRLRVENEGSARPREVLAALNIESIEYEGFFLTRTRVEME